MVQEIPLGTLPEGVQGQGQSDKGGGGGGGVMPRHRYKEMRILLINTVAFL